MSAIRSLHEAIEHDFIAGCGRLAEARRLQRCKDSTSNRASVTECWTVIDAILDMHLAAETARR
jgi:hypothetical protein